MKRRLTNTTFFDGYTGGGKMKDESDTTVLLDYTQAGGWNLLPDFAQQLERKLADQKEQFRVLEDEMLVMMDERNAAVKDAERYRWLRDNSHNTPVGVYEWVERDGRQQRAWLCSNELDAAIDAAMKEMK